ncbi:MAG: YedE-related selenium metabolism membrane protein [Syntrophus sp. (in: bacteria)]|nr:YedE-related selenium metabolism membrane protein [Syntrophus sp. (in: bacteria)]
MDFIKNHWKIIVCGLFIGVVATLLQKFGNPANMGICVACFERDIAGALGFHRIAVVQYIRPEILFFVIGSFVSSLMFREFKPRGGSLPLVRFLLGFFAMFGALVFLGCPWRAILRLAGGDWNAIIGILGIIIGIYIGIQFIKRGYTLGRSYPAYKLAGLIMPLMMFGLLLLLLVKPSLTTGAPFFSEKGPGSQHAPIIFSVCAAFLIGIFAQRTRFCTVGAIRDVILMKDFHLASGVISLLVFAFISNLILGQFRPGFEGQPIAHTNYLWNFLGMVLSGLSYALAGGCPGRQLFLSGEGDIDAGVFVIGMITGAGFAHNFAVAASSAGIGPWSAWAVIVGLLFCLATGMFMRKRIA